MYQTYLLVKSGLKLLKFSLLKFKFDEGVFELAHLKATGRFCLIFVFFLEKLIFIKNKNAYLLQWLKDPKLH